MQQTGLLLFSIANLVLGIGSTPCLPRDYGYGGVVCVCNATYCDDFDDLPEYVPGEIVVITSTQSGLRHDVTKVLYGNLTGGTTFILNATREFQTMEGFGGNICDSAGINLAGLTKEAQDHYFQSYYGAKGIRYSLTRIPIGGTDFSTHPYTLDDGPVDLNLERFNLTFEDYNYKIPYLKKAQDLTDGKLRLLAAAWTAPPWMKTNNDYIGRGSLKTEYYELWAEYLLRFLDEYNKQGLRIWSLSTGNEPMNGNVPFFFFNCMGWSGETQGEWVAQYLGPKLAASPFNDTVILALDDQRFHLPGWPKKLADAGAMEYISYIGVHWYWDNLFPLDLLDQTHDLFNDKVLINSEASFNHRANFKEENMSTRDDVAVHLGSWFRGENLAERMIDDFNHWVAGWLDWCMNLDPQGGPTWVNNTVDSPVIVNVTANELYKQPMYYSLGHFSRFIPPGSVRIYIDGGNDFIKSTAFVTPERKLVIVLVNKEETPQDVSILGAPQGPISLSTPPKSILTLISGVTIND